MCNAGLRPHKDGKHFEKFENCGITEDLKPINCAVSCDVVDYWISGIEDKPLTIIGCGPKELEPDHSEKLCRGKCLQDGEDPDTVLHELGKSITNDLYILMKTPEKLTKECLNMLTRIDAKTTAYCNMSDNCNDFYCPEKKDDIVTCKPMLIPSNPNGINTTVNDNENTMTKIPQKASSQGEDNNGNENTMTDSPQKASSPDKENTSAGANKIDALIGTFYLAITFTINIILAGSTIVKSSVLEF